MIRLALLLGALALPAGAQDGAQDGGRDGAQEGAQQGDRTAAILDAFEGWMADHAVPEGSIAVVPAEGAPALRGYGRPAGAPVTLASLSKAITGACIATLRQRGALDLAAPLADLLPYAPAGGGLAGDPLTVADALSHRTGTLVDATQGRPLHLAEDRAPAHDAVARAALSGARSPLRTFRYDNQNYAILGAAIDSLAPEGYFAACARLLFEGSGIAAGPDPVWGPLGAWGGWAMPPLDYARFIADRFAPGRDLGLGPAEWPHADLGGGTAYVMGAFHRMHGGRALFWHAGLLCWDGAGDGAYFASYGADPVVVASFAGCAPEDAIRALDAALFDAALP